MANLQWSVQLEHSLPAMDDTHREFVQLLGQVEAASDAELPPLWAALVAHTEAHFAQEERWMQDTGFDPDNCHSGQHKVVMALLHKALAQAQAGDVALVRSTTQDLISWLPYHAETMDAALAEHLHLVGYEAVCSEGASAQAAQLAQAAIAHAARTD